MLARLELELRHASGEIKVLNVSCCFPFYMGFKGNCPKASSLLFNLNSKFLVSTATENTRREN